MHGSIKTPPKAAILKLSDTLVNETETSHKALQMVGRDVLELNSEDQKSFADTVLKSLGNKWNDCAEFKELTNTIGRGSREMLLFARSDDIENFHVDYQSKAKVLFPKLDSFRNDLWSNALKSALPEEKVSASLVQKTKETAIQKRWEPNTAVLLPEAHGFLEALKKQKIASCIVTNGLSNWQREIITHAGLHNFVGENVVVSGDLGCASSSPDIVKEALKKVNIPAQDAFFVGNQAKDISAANEVGITRAYWLESPEASGSSYLRKNQLGSEAAPSSDKNYHRVKNFSTIAQHIGVPFVGEKTTPDRRAGGVSR